MNVELILTILRIIDKMLPMLVTMLVALEKIVSNSDLSKEEKEQLYKEIVNIKAKILSWEDLDIDAD